MVLDLLHKVCQDGHRCFQTTVAVFWQLRRQGIEAVHEEQPLLLAEIGQKIFDLLVFLRIQTKNLFLCQDTIGRNFPQDAAGFVRVDLGAGFHSRHL